MKRIRSHENDTLNFSPALIQPYIERPLTGLQFDLQQKIKLVLCESYFRASDSIVVTFTPRNYTSKSNFRKRCCLCYGNEIGPGQKMPKKIKKSQNQCQTCDSSTCLRYNKFLLRALINAEICFMTNSNNYIE